MNAPPAPAESFNWLEDAESPRVEAWVAEQNRQSEAYIKTLPLAEAFLDELLPLNRLKGPTRSKVTGSYWYYLDYAGSNERHALRARDLNTGADRVVLELSSPALSKYRSISNYWPSYDNKYVAVALDGDGSDVKDLAIFRADGTAVLVEMIGPADDPGVAWTPDSASILFRHTENIREQKPTERVSRARVVRRLVRDRDDRRVPLTAVAGSPEVWEWPITSPTSPWIALERNIGTAATEIYARPLTGQHEWRLIARSRAGGAQIRLDGDLLYATITDETGQASLEAFDLSRAEATRRVVWRGSRERVLVSFDLLKDAIGLRLLADAKHVVELVSRRDGQPLERTASMVGTEPGSIEGPLGDPRADTAVYAFASMRRPRTFFAVSSKTGVKTIWSTANFDGSDLVVEQAFATADDGVRIPYFVLRQAGPHGAPRPTVLYGYGGHGKVTTSEFLAGPVVWARHGGTYVVANIRGGGEYGEAWHEAGRRRNKPRAFDDYLTVADDLVRRGITTPGMLVARGASHAALTATAAAIRRPSLFGALLCRIPVIDMLRFDQIGLGRVWISEFGDPSDEGDRRVLAAYSPLHNIRAGVQYPPALIIAGARDERAPAVHAEKLAAALQSLGRGGPYLLRVEATQGHGGPGTLTDNVRQDAEMLAFAYQMVRGR